MKSHTVSTFQTCRAWLARSFSRVALNSGGKNRKTAPWWSWERELGGEGADVGYFWKVTKWNSWTLCAPALCAAVTRCLSLSTCHCPGNYTAAGSPIRLLGRRERPTFRGKATGRGGTADRSRWMTGRWRDPWSWVAGPGPGCTVTETAPCPADDPGQVAAAAGRPPASPWPNESRWHGRNTNCSPWRPRQRTVAGPVLGATFPGRGKRWWSSSFSSI